MSGNKKDRHKQSPFYPVKHCKYCTVIELYSVHIRQWPQKWDPKSMLIK